MVWNQCPNLKQSKVFGSINLIAISDGQSEVRSEEKMKRINYDAKTKEF